MMGNSYFQMMHPSGSYFPPSKPFPISQGMQGEPYMSGKEVSLPSKAHNPYLLIPSDLKSTLQMCNLVVNSGNQKKIGKLTWEERLKRIERYRAKKAKRVWVKKISYGCRKRVADQRLRIKGRFISKSEANGMQNSDQNEEKCKVEANERPRIPEPKKSMHTPVAMPSMMSPMPDTAQKPKSKEVGKPLFSIIKASN
jgi:hypothetical protein